MLLLIHLGWVRIGWKRWIQPEGVTGETEGECLRRVQQWMVREQKAGRLDVGDGQRFR
jgi:hypothetical protein